MSKRKDYEFSNLPRFRSLELALLSIFASGLIITSNQAVSQWDQIFPDNMMTVAAIDRIIHHASVIEIDTESYRKKNHKEIR